MKKCSKCNVEKSYEQFSKCSKANDGLQWHCKECKKNPEYNKQKYWSNPELHKSKVAQHYRDNTSYYKQKSKEQLKNATLPYYIVYLLPQHNYVGYTNQPYFRMNNHKRDGRDTTGWYELARFKNEQDAWEFERSKHAEGYNGEHPNHLKNFLSK